MVIRQEGIVLFDPARLGPGRGVGEAFGIERCSLARVEHRTHLRTLTVSISSTAKLQQLLSSMGQSASQVSSSSPATCPTKHDSALNSASSSSALAKCPIDHSSSSNKAALPQPPAQCPIKHDNAELNPLNQMPTLSQAPAAQQSAELPTSRETSSIPRDEASRWEYPSPQQFYNALVRKGWETPEEHVETMVHIHNFLNEEAWQEIVKWEKKQNPYVVPIVPYFAFGD